MNPAVKWTLRLGVIPVAIASYITVAGLTGFCPSCKAVVDGIRGLHEPMSRPASAAPSIAGLAGVSLEGESVPLATAGKPMIIELWATWCGPCHRQRAIIKEMGAELSSKVTLVGMSVDTDPRAVAKFLADKPSGMLELMAPPETLVAFGGVTAVPTLVFVDASGAIRGVASGVHSASLLKARVAELTATATAN
jgi:thiol-disulfide isomerase/thioredoxin